MDRVCGRAAALVSGSPPVCGLRRATLTWPPPGTLASTGAVRRAGLQRQPGPVRMVGGTRPMSGDLVGSRPGLPLHQDAKVLLRGEAVAVRGACDPARRIDCRVLADERTGPPPACGKESIGRCTRPGTGRRPPSPSVHGCRERRRSHPTVPHREPVGIESGIAATAANVANDHGFAPPRPLAPGLLLVALAPPGSPPYRHPSYTGCGCPASHRGPLSTPGRWQGYRRRGAQG